MSESQELTDPSPPCGQHLIRIAIDLAVCVVGFAGMTSGNQSLLVVALIIVYAYGSWVFFKSSLAAKIHQAFKGRGPLGGILMLILFGFVAPAIHLVYSIVSYVSCPDSFIARAFSRLLVFMPALDGTWSYVRGLFVGSWGWLVVLAFIAVVHNLLLRVPGLLGTLISAVQAAEPDFILGQLIYYLLALPLALVFLVLAFIMEVAWKFLAMALTLIIAGFLTISILPLMAGEHWPKTRWIVAGSAITIVISILVYLVPVSLWLLPSTQNIGIRLDLFTSLPFLVTSSVLAVFSLPFLHFWVRLSYEDTFSAGSN